jgi:CelD/BcsL family acetyltransferase involved in cellulose biosynthesis
MFRSTVRYRTNKLTKNYAVTLLRTKEPGEIEPHLDRLFEMHQRRWEAEGHPGSFRGLAKRAFYADVSREFLRRDWLRFYHLEVDGMIRASQFGFAFRGVLHSLQEAFDHEFHPPGVGGVGVVLRGLALRECIAEGLRGYDFLGGEEEFKTRWGTQTLHVRSVRIGAPGISGAAAFALTAGARRVKLWMRARSPGWLLERREAWRSWDRSRRARRAAQKAAGVRE